MPKKRYNAEEIIHKLRGADILLGQGKTVSQACKQIGVSDQTYYRWRKAYGGRLRSSASAPCGCTTRATVTRHSRSPRANPSVGSPTSSATPTLN